MRILALDLATRTGWALWSGGYRTEISGVQDFTLQRGESPGMRFIRFEAWLCRMLDDRAAATVPVEVIVYEMPHMRGGAATTILVGLEVLTQKVAASRGIEFSKIHGASVRKRVLGSGKPGKDASVAWAWSHLGRPPIDDNEADALMVLEWARQEFGGAAA